MRRRDLSLGPIDPSRPVEWTEPLNRGLLGWWLRTPLPGWSGGLTFRSLARGARTPIDGTLNGSPTWQGAVGRPGGHGCLYFNGADTVYVETSPPNEKQPVITVSSWYRWAAGTNGNYADLVNVTRNNNETPNNTWLGGILRTDGVTGSSATLSFLIGKDGGQEFASGGTLLTGTWYHTAGTYDGSTIRVYLNGVEVGSTSFSGSFLWTNAFGSVGRVRFGSKPFGGQHWQDDVRLYSRALSAAEVHALYADSRRGCSRTLGRVRRGPFFTPAAAGGTTYPVNLSGSLALSGAVAKDADKALSGTLTPSAALAKSAAKPLSGTLSPSGSLARSAAKALAGALSLAGSTLTRAASKALTGSLGLAGALAKAVAKPLSGSLTLSGGALSTLRVYLRSFAGSLTLTGSTVAKAVGKALTGSLTPAGSLAKQAARGLTGSLTLSGGALSALRVYLRSFAGSLTLTGSTITRAADKSLTGSLALTASALAKSAGKALSGSLTLSGSYSGLRAVLRSFSGALALSGGTLARAASKGLAGTLTPSGALAKAISKSLTASLSLGGALGKLAGKAWSAVLSLAGALTTSAAQNPAADNPTIRHTVNFAATRRHTVNFRETVRHTVSF